MAEQEAGPVFEDKEKALDFANYFCSYGFLYHQKDMLQDRGRMNAYRNAIMRNPGCFQDKVVLDVGTGSGVLAIWAAKAGAKRVYAVEATAMATHARALAERNGVGQVVQILEGYMEQQNLPEKVDIIISEWMGYMLLRESMFDSVIVARDQWLAPGGAMYPSHAQLHMAPLCSKMYAARMADYEEELNQWQEFEMYMTEENDLDLEGLRGAYDSEQLEYLLQSAQWCQLPDSERIGERFTVLSLDTHNCTKEDVTVVRSDFQSVITHPAALLNAFAGWFDVQFCGSDADQAPNPVELTTAPSHHTHWAQQLFYVHPPLEVQAGDVIKGSIHLTRQRTNHRLLYLQVKFSVLRAGPNGPPAMPIAPERTCNFKID
uniref:Protein arginine N-methyltransferase domain-containing protein n=1 Tax=Prymnesium polylepis TaxID=72548 RepID=A0A6T8DAZ0_9EUKA